MHTTTTTTSLLPLLLLLLLSLLIPSSLSAPTFTKIYAFGDSYTDTGNTRSATGPRSFTSVSRLPYGSTFFHHPTNRYSDGRLLIDFLSSLLSLHFLPPYLHVGSSSPSNGVNFAVAGATAIEHEFFVRNNMSLDITPQSLGTQLEWFDKFLEGRGCSGERLRECGEVGEDALFWVGEIGANDYAYSIGSEMTPKEIREHAVKNVAIFVKALLDRGAKYIIVQGLPLTGCLPLAMILSPTTDRDDLNCSASVNTYSNLHNSLLQSKLQQLRSQYPTALISYADYYSAHRTIMKNPEAHGFNEPFKVCCGSGGGPYNFDPFATCASPKAQKACSNPRKFVNWDGVHLTEAVYKNVADMFFHQNYCRPSFSVLLSDKKNRG